MNLEEARIQAHIWLDGSPHPSTADYFAEIVLELADEVDRLERGSERQRRWLEQAHKMLELSLAELAEWRKAAKGE